MLLGFFVPLVSYVALMLARPQFMRRVPVPAAWAAMLVAVVGAATVLTVIGVGGHWNGTTEIAWVGARSARGQPSLTIGGEPEEAALGWPNRAFAPAIKITAASETSATVDVERGGGFVRVGDRLMNGEPLREGESKTVGSFRILLTPTLLGFGPRRLTISDAAGSELAWFKAHVRSKDRVIPLAQSIANSVVHLRTRDAVRAAEFEDWALDLWMLITPRGEIRLLRSRDRHSGQITLPTRITVLWPRVTLPVDVQRAPDGRVTMEFPPPWRLASPIPPPATLEETTSHLTITTRAIPGDSAFIIPTGARLADQRETVGIQAEQFSRPERQADTRSSQFQPRTERAGESVAGVTSRKWVSVGDFQVQLATVRDLPRLGYFLAALVVALITFGLGLWLTVPGMHERDGWVLAGLAAAVWSLLAFRVTLAYRYAMDPTHLDGLALSGLTWSIVGLALVPAILLTAARLRRDQVTPFDFPAAKRRAGRQVLVYLLLLVVAYFGEKFFATSLWVNANLLEQPRLGVFERVGIVVLCLFVAGYVVVRYAGPPRAAAGTRSLSPRQLHLLTRLRAGFLAPFGLFEWICKDLGPRLWSYVGSSVEYPADEDERRVAYRRRHLWQLCLMILLYDVVVIGVIIVSLIVLPAGKKYVQEIVAPILLAWIPAALCLSARLRFPPHTHFVARSEKVARAALAGLLFFGPVLSPVLLGDTGGIVAMLCLFIPIISLLWIGWRPLSVPGYPTVALVLCFVTGMLVYVNLPTALPGQAGVRVLVFREGMQTQEALPWLSLDPSQGSVTVRNLRDGLQHTRENQAIAHEGGWWGLGYGHAPTRRSHIRQDTLQYDSTFSFFVLSENGVLGGTALLLLYALPLGLVLVSARRQFDIGHGIACAVAATFFLEALFHAGMNVGAFPFTGRNLPLLAVNSKSDLVRWLVLWCIAVHALSWRATGESDDFVDDRSLLSPILDHRPVDAPPAVEPARLFAIGAGAVALVPVALFIAVMVTIVLVAVDPVLDHPFDWSGMLRSVERDIAEGRITVDQSGQVTVAPALQSSGVTLIEQEVLRFNALTQDEKEEGAHVQSRDFLRRLRALRSLDDYDAMMADFREHHEAATHRHPSLFTLHPPLEWADEDETVPTVDAGFRLGVNPAFNNRVSFSTLSRPRDFPTISFRDGVASTFIVSGHDFEIPLVARAAEPGENRSVLLGADGSGGLRPLRESGSGSSRVQVSLRFQPPGKAGMQTKDLGRFEVTGKGLAFRPGDLIIELRRDRGKPKRLAKNSETLLEAGDVLELPEKIAQNLRPRFVLRRSVRGALIGPAWVMGRFELVHDPLPLVPWTGHLVRALSAEWKRLGPVEAAQRYGTLSLDRDLQTAAQAFVAQHGRTLHRRMFEARRPLAGIPPRVALCAVSLPSGEVLALGGWPRTNPDRFWRTAGDNEQVPPSLWVEEFAPTSLRRRYTGDRNFDRLVVGSASKPLWAAAALAVHKDLDTRLSVSGQAELEDDVFGIKLDGSWKILAASSALDDSAWADFRSFLAKSDNRYQVRLGFLGLASPAQSGAGIDEDGRSSSRKESLDRGRTPWGYYPKFPDAIRFSRYLPGDMRNLEKTDLAERLRRMYAIGTTQGEVSHRISFWTANEAHDWPAAANSAFSSRGLFRYIAPEAPDFALNTIEKPRRYVTLLLGGGTNLWSNVDFAGAFGTTVTGMPTIVHVTRTPTPATPAEWREEFREIASRLHPGLSAVLEHSRGTAHRRFADSGALSSLAGLPRVKVYAKTGTLQWQSKVKRQQVTREMSRIVLAIVRWSPKGDGVEAGVVFSLVVDQASLGTSTGWLAEFIRDQMPTILHHLGG